MYSFKFIGTVSSSAVLKIIMTLYTVENYRLVVVLAGEQTPYSNEVLLVDCSLANPGNCSAMTSVNIGLKKLY